MPFNQAAVCSGSALTLFHLFSRWVGPRHALSASLPPSKPVRPHVSVFNYRVFLFTLSIVNCNWGQAFIIFINKF